MLAGLAFCEMLSQYPEAPFQSGESNRPLTPIHAKKYRDTPPISMAYFCKSMPSLWQKVVYTPPICITIRLPFVSRYFCGSIRVRGRWDTPNSGVVVGRRGGQQQFATQTLRVHLLGVDRMVHRKDQNRHLTEGLGCALNNTN